ncbi:hypothetical protein BB559_000105 [Furculomyces boomerangus]|uniref:Peroxin-3 n=2 Tax=Harpellales TaxID=61421 RepID=A0A2T9Z6D4_9FUNG|nr:hypothetical protein BB559_004710 [Furculomyces boomerangus]PVV00112.1 hypothetical protein BB559_000105 [Furculomyces boomerangus]PWA00559.1 hypothetical protein BB558_003376 [Smittium angustum]
MLSIVKKTSNFLKRNRNTILVLSGTVGGLVYSVGYLKDMLVKMQESMEHDSWSKTNISERFERNLRDCKYTIQSLSSELNQKILSEIDVESLIEELKTISKTKKDQTIPQSSDSPNPSTGLEESISSEFSNQTFNTRSKLEVWEDIKIKSFTRAMVVAYSQVLLSVLVHCQLNIIGQQTYNDSITRKYDLSLYEQTEPQTPNSPSLGFNSDDQNFLILSWWFLNKGWKIVAQIVQQSVFDVLGRTPLKAKISYSKLGSIIAEINDSVLSKDITTSISDILLPRSITEYDDFLEANDLSIEFITTPKFQSMVAQFMDILESEALEKVFTIELAKITSVFVNSLRDIYPPPNPLNSSQQLGYNFNHSNENIITNVDASKSISDVESAVKEFENYAEPEPKVGLVKILPRIAKETQLMLFDLPNPYLESLCSSREMQALSASIYTAVYKD